MTLKKADLIQSIIDNVHFKKKKRERQQYLFQEFNREPLSRKKASDILETLIEIIKSRLERGDDVGIPGFGKFRVRIKRARKGRKPKTGEILFIKSKRSVAFQCFKKLRKRVNE